MAVQDLFPRPPKYNLPLSKGQDLYAIFVYKPIVLLENGQPDLDADGNKQFVEADYPVNCTVTMHIDVDDDTTLAFDAAIAGSKALVWEDFLTVDPVLANKLWRTKINYESGYNKVMCNGVTVRSDGK